MRNRSSLNIGLAIASLIVPGFAQSFSAGKPWAAQWITASSAPQKDEVVLHFRKVIEIASVPAHYVVDVSADNQFLFYVNQQRVGTGPSRSDLAHWRYETYDIAPFLRAGKNVLAATVWNFGTNSALAQMSDRTAFLVHGEDEAGKIADTNETWEVEREEGIKTLPTQLDEYYAAEPGERLDGVAFDWQWNASSKRGPWQQAMVLSRASPRLQTDAPNNWQLVPDPLPSMEMKEVTGGRVDRAAGIALPKMFPANGFEVPPHTQATILIDNSELTTAYPSLAVDRGHGSTIRLTYAEALFDDKGEKGNRDQIEGEHIIGISDEFLPAGRDCEFVPLSWRTWRYLQLDITTGDEALQVKGLRVWFTAYPFLEKAQFHSDDQTLTRIWDVSWRTARLDAHDTYMDTPYWERLQYVGDTRIQALISYTVADDDRLARQAIEGYNNSRIPDGLTQSRYPSSLMQIIPTFSLLWVGMVHDFWMYRGDSDFVRAQLPGVRAVLDWYLSRLRRDGLVGKLPWWPFVDWGKDFPSGVPPQDEDGGSSIISLQLVEALGYADEMESALGDGHFAAVYRNAAERVRKSVYESCWNAQHDLLADSPAQRHYSQHANILGVWLDVIPIEKQREVLEKTISTTDPGVFAAQSLPPMTAATYYFRFYLARALEHAGLGEQYLQLLGPWKNMLSLGLTTWAESPEPTRSDSHAWSAHPDYDFLTTVAGVCPTAPGFKSFRIEPHLGNLNYVNARVPTPRGFITLEFKRTAAGIRADIVKPTDASGEVIWKGKSTPLRETHESITLPD
jgi:alpha-L-rhamnosidase